MSSTMGERTKNNDRAQNDSLPEFILSIKKYYSSLYYDLSNMEDPRKTCTYPIGLMLLVLFFKYSFSIVSMHEMDTAMLNSIGINNILHFANGAAYVKNGIPHYQTINDLLVLFKYVQLENLLTSAIYCLLRRKVYWMTRYRCSRSPSAALSLPKRSWCSVQP